MTSNKVYTIGGNDMKWRKQIEEACRNIGQSFEFIHPPLYRTGISDEEFEEWSFFQICNSNIVIVNLEEIDDEAIFELGLIDGINAASPMEKHIFVIGIGEFKADLNPHIKFAIFHHEPKYKDAADYIQSVLLV